MKQLHSDLQAQKIVPSLIPCILICTLILCKFSYFLFISSIYFILALISKVQQIPQISKDKLRMIVLTILFLIYPSTEHPQTELQAQIFMTISVLLLIFLNTEKSMQILKNFQATLELHSFNLLKKKNNQIIVFMGIIIFIFILKITITQFCFLVCILGITWLGSPTVPFLTQLKKKSEGIDEKIKVIEDQQNQLQKIVKGLKDFQNTGERLQSLSNETEKMQGKYDDYYRGISEVKDVTEKKIGMYKKIEVGFQNVVDIMKEQENLQKQIKNVHNSLDNINGIVSEFAGVQSQMREACEGTEEDLKVITSKIGAINEFKRQINENKQIINGIEEEFIDTKRYIREMKDKKRQFEESIKFYEEYFLQRQNRGEQVKEEQVKKAQQDLKQKLQNLNDKIRRIKLINTSEKMETISAMNDQINKNRHQILKLQNFINDKTYEVIQKYGQIKQRLKNTKNKVQSTNNLTRTTQLIKETAGKINSSKKNEVNEIAIQAEDQVEVIDSHFVGFPSLRGSRNGDKMLPTSNFLDIIFCLDTTGSMGPHIEEAKSTIKLIVDSISSKMQTTHLILRFGVVAYRDHVKGEKYLTKINKFTDNQKTLEFVEQLDAEGGGDYPEAVLDGLEQVINLNWFRLRDEKKLRYTFHITDAPPHGTAFTAEGDETDCKCGKKMVPILQKFNEKNIYYHLVKVVKNYEVERMDRIFGSILRKYDSIFISEIKETRQNIVNTILRKMIE